MPTTAFIFPGQGAQTVGMGRDLVENHETARAIFDCFDSIVTPDGNPKLSTVCFEGPEDTLKRTLYTQPAILATSLAAFTLFVTKTGISPDATAGHSLGEYGALVAAQCISIETSAKLIAKRAGLMEQAPAGAMSAVLGLPYEVIETVIARLLQTYPNAITVANYNTADQAVISGSVEAVQAAAEPLKAAGAKRVLPLPVGGAFHSPLMQQAAVEFLDTLNKETFQMPICPVISNVDAAPSSSPADLQNKLGRQIDNSVLWAQTMAEMVDVMGVTRVFEFGPGKVLTGMMRKAYPQVQVYNIFDSASLDEVCAQVQNTDPIGAIH